jgi:hypothetical protein
MRVNDPHFALLNPGYTLAVKSPENRAVSAGRAGCLPF